jgi:ubiquinone/menaquinone biosynthesis C-methylase UbiE
VVATIEDPVVIRKILTHLGLLPAADARSRPASQPPPAVHALGFDPIVPLIGRAAGQGGAYVYLVRSVQQYPSPERIAEITGEAGLVDVPWRGPTGGIVTLPVGTVLRG